MAIDPRALRPADLVRILNSTHLGQVLSDRQLRRHREQAGFRIIDFLTLVTEFERHGVALVSLKEEINTESASGRVMTTIMVALAQFEREQTSERTKEKMGWRAGKGLPIGPPPLGYEMHEKHFRVVPAQAENVHFLERTYLESRSLDKTARVAHAKGIRSRRGMVLTKDAIGRILRNPLYTGRLPYKGGTHQGQHEAIRDEATQEKLSQLLEKHWKRKTNGISHAKSYAYLLQGLVVCGHCRGRMVPKAGRGRGGKPYPYYTCSAANKTAGIVCQHNSLPAQEADQHVLAYVKQLALRDDLVLRLGTQQDLKDTEALAKLRADRQGLADRIAENRRQTTNLARAIGRMAQEAPEGMLETARAYERERRELEASATQMDAEMARLESAQARSGEASRTVRFLAEALDWPGITPERLRELLPKFIDYLVWKKAEGTREGTFELALFERPFRREGSRPLRELVPTMPQGSDDGKSITERPPDGQNGRSVDSQGDWFARCPVWRG